MRPCCTPWVTLLLFAGCATKPPARTTLPEATYRPRAGVVESVEKLAQQYAPSSASDNVILTLFVGGLLFRGLLFHRGTGPVVGVEGGNAAIAYEGGAPSALPRYRVHIRFDDGTSMTLVYTNDVAFHRGERVEMTQQGLVAAGSRRPEAIATQ